LRKEMLRKKDFDSRISKTRRRGRRLKETKPRPTRERPKTRRGRFWTTGTMRSNTSS